MKRLHTWYSVIKDLIKRGNKVEITIAELEKLAPEEYKLIDIRSEYDTSYGTIPGAENIPLEELDEKLPENDGKKVILFCARGIFSRDAADELCEKGYEAYSLKEGYTGWLMQEIKRHEAEEQMHEDADAEFKRIVELSLQKRFRKSIFSKFTKAIREYELVKEGDRIAVCISGGKDSMLMAKCFQELKRHDKFPFEVEYIVMDPGYSPENRGLIEDNARRLGVPVRIFESDIFDAVYDIEKSPCYLCARMRRGYLYSFAKSIGCNKIALGHHYDDVIETILMGMLYGAQVQTMMPKLHSTNFEGMELIRPLYLVREDEIKAWRDYNGLRFLQCACRFTDTCSVTDGKDSKSKRIEIKNLIRELKKTNSFVEGNIFKSVENVNLDTVIAYKQKGVRHNFLEGYDE
ncbi:MAG: ATPase [Lachnospiraceae bacterium]|nr:ATPase [Lachnospiraceae bacterium]